MPLTLSAMACVISNTTQSQYLMASHNLSTAKNFNSSDSCQVSIWEWKEWEYTLQSIYIMAVGVIGIVENSLILIVMCLHKSCWTVPDIYLTNLAAADLLVLISLPFLAVSIAKHFHWPHGEFLCHYIGSLLSMNVYCSVFFLTMVSIDRYLALVKVLGHWRIRTTLCAKINCFFIWTFGLFLSSPVTILNKIVRFDMNVTICTLDYPNRTWYLLMETVQIVMLFLVPVVIISFCTFHILKVLRNNQIKCFKQMRQGSKAIYLVLFVFLAFILCWMPYHLLRLLRILGVLNVLPSCPWGIVIYNGLHIIVPLACTSSCINCIFYILMGKQFRKKVRELYIQATVRKRVITACQ
ncbi:B2 bradykinin receptor-like [Scyliorhinus canicula]|uniref:B2 bradykinin receptor-like n=1 Tax=Scyliorhinus canicula TaxID=7830 RepID=UPI0018F35533|nr:B2 bradykinin receptor-like [Scyliorhinus canicula]